MTQIQKKLAEIKKQVTAAGSMHIESLPPMPINDFLKEMKPFVKMEKIINKLQKKYKT